MHPDLYYRDCNTCRFHMYDEDGEHKGKPTIRHGEHLRRPRGTHPPCERDSGCPKGHWSKPVTLNARQQRAYKHYRECKLTGRWTEDALVLERAIALDDLMGAIERARAMEQAIAAATTAAATRGI